MGYIPECVMEDIVSRNKKIQQLQRWFESHEYDEHKQHELDRLIRLGVNEYYDRMNHVPKRVRKMKIAANQFVADFADIQPAS